jgi:capsular polysaccharide biosynthesis protein
MSRLIRFIARLYPRSWRQRYGAEFDALLEDVRPDGPTVANVLTGALVMHIRTWKSWKILGVAAMFGAAVVAGLFAAIPKSYVSKAVVKVGAQGDRADTIDAINALAMDLESRGSLTSVITTYNLYLRERSRMPLEDVLEEMKRNIIIEPLGANVPAFRISFNYGDPKAAQKVTQALVAGFMAENFRQPRDVTLQLLDAASLPQSSTRSNPVILGFGVACFLVMWGALSAWRSVSTRRYAAAGSTISSSESPGGGAAELTPPPFRKHLRRNSWKILAAVALLIAVAALSFKLATSSYESKAVVRVLPPASPQAIFALAQSVEDRFSLSRIITTYNLYPGERASLLGGDVTEQMKKHIRIEPVSPGSKNVAGFLIRFSYPDPFIAQKVTQELASQFVDASSDGSAGATLSVLDPASLPTPGLFFVEPGFNIGLFCGLPLGAILAVIVALFRRSPAPV